MNRTLAAVDADWQRVVHSKEGHEALARWRADESVLASAKSLDDILTLRRDPEFAQSILLALARRAPTDVVAARALLQALVPGLKGLANRVWNDAGAFETMLSLAWERIRTYPQTRNGSVAWNVLLDTKKRYHRQRGIGGPARCAVPSELPDEQVASPEDVVLDRTVYAEMMTAQRNGLINPTIARAIVRTRVEGYSLAEVASEENLSVSVLRTRRRRAELRLRSRWVKAH